MRVAPEAPEIVTTPSAMGRNSAVTVQWPALAFASAAAALPAIVFSLVPAIHALRFDLLYGLKEAAASVPASAGQKRLQNALASGQIALAMVLLSACGLLSLNMIHLRSAGLGFDPQRTFTFQIGLPTARYPQSDRFRFADELTAKLRAIPGVLSVSASGYDDNFAVTTAGAGGVAAGASASATTNNTSSTLAKVGDGSSVNLSNRGTGASLGQGGRRLATTEVRRLRSRCR